MVDPTKPTVEGEEPIDAVEEDGEDAAAGMPDMAEMMKMLGGGKGGGKGEGGKPDMASLMSMLGGMGGGGGDGDGGMGGMGDMMSMLGGGKGGMGGMGGKGGMMGGKGGGGQQPEKDDGEKQADGYVWQQKGDEVQVRFDKEGLTKKDIKCTFKRASLKVELAGEVVLEGNLFGSVDVDDCCWSIDPDTKQCQVMLTKQDESKQWASLMA